MSDLRTLIARAAEKAGGVPTLAKQIGIGRQTLYNVINHGHVPSGRTLLKLKCGGLRFGLGALE